MSDLLELRGIHKRFGAVAALTGANFSIAPGERHALLGENGAGKTTLMHVAYGLVRPDAGTIYLRGAPVTLRSPRDARRLGLGMVHQHFTSVPALSVAENIALAAGWGVRPRALRRRVADVMGRVGLELHPDHRAGDLSVALQQRLEILKALASEADVLLLDEPTAVLAPSEVAGLFGVIDRFATTGGAVVLITHKLREALAATDRVTVLRTGRVTFAGPTAGETAESLAEYMIGRPAESAARSVSVPPRPEPVLTMRGVSVPPDRGQGTGLVDGALTVAAGEIVGIAAVEGNGQRELLRAAAGLLLPSRGTVDRVGAASLVPEDRVSEGIVPAMSLAENVVLGQGRSGSWVRGRLGLVDWRAAERYTAKLVKTFSIMAAGSMAPAGTLSGGNQQKLILARALESNPSLLVAENPTRGLDFRATAFVHERLRGAATAGAGVLFYSSDLDEVLGLSTRVVVVVGGRTIPVGPPLDRLRVGALMVGGTS